MAPHIVLNECNQPVTMEKINTREPRTAEFLKVNSRGQVPVLVDGDTVIREGAAILIHIAEKHKSSLLPESGKDRDAALEWLMFCNSTLHPAYARCFFLKNAMEDSPAKEKALNTAYAMINKLWADVEERLAQTPYLAGASLTLGDILLAVIANWGSMLPNPAAITIGPRCKKLLKAVSERPSYQKALQAEQVEYKAAA